MATTPGFLRGVAVADIIGAIHNAHTAGPWALDCVTTNGTTTMLEFKVGVVYPDKPDYREIVRIAVTA